MPISSRPQQVFEQLCQYQRETKILQSISALLDWDQQTGMPVAASPYRSQQSAWLAERIHQRQTATQMGQWLNELADTDLAADPFGVSGSTIRVLKHEFDKKSRLPSGLVRDQAVAHSLGQQIWVTARRENDFNRFAPQLEKIVRLKREEAQATATGDCLYDALLDDYEPGARTDDVITVLDDLKRELIPLVDAVTRDNPGDRAEVLRRHYPASAQREFARQVSAAAGFDYQRGRLDTAAHPFCTEMGPDDVRLTTRFNENWFSGAFFGTLHETGHGLYEQGLPAEHYGLPPGTCCSLGIHESQSRLWENLVGRSRGFWEHFLPLAACSFPAALGGTTVDEFYTAVNQIQPSLIRVEADEMTYNLHIVIRVELEIALLNDELQVADLPGAWNERYQKYLGRVPDRVADGVLQDIHWSAGLFGYFSTYTLGNIFASQLFEAAGRALGDLENQFARGEFAPLLNWLRQHVHAAGACCPSGELMQRAAGSPLDLQPLVTHLSDKASQLYGIGT